MKKIILLLVVSLAANAFSQEEETLNTPTQQEVTLNTPTQQEVTLNTLTQQEESLNIATKQREVFEQANRSLLLRKKVKRVSLGIKLGVPNAASINAEAVLPILGNRIAPFADFSKFNLNESDTEVDFSYLEYGVNFYFKSKGKGVYASVSKGQFDADLTFTNVTLESYDITGTGDTDLVLEPTNVKLGIKTGGRFYFRFEAGFGLADVPKELEFTGTGVFEGTTVTDTVTETRPEIPGISDNGFIIANIGFGISF